VAIRRLVAALDVVAVVARGDHAAGIRKRVKKLLRAFSPLRDTQVQIITVGDLAATHPALAPLRTVLLLREQRLTTKLAERIRSVHEAGHGSAVEALARDIAGVFLSRRSARSAHAAVLAAGNAAFAQSALLRESLDAARPETIHRLRVSFKKLRYTVEMLAPTLPWANRELFARMNAYQTAMGEIQDAEVLDAMVRAYERRQEGALLAPERRLLTSRRRVLVNRFLGMADDLYTFWPIPPGAPRDLRGAAARRKSG
jgi:CHAD domain-containing protein